MKFVLYFLVYSSLVIGLFSTFMYLMTIVDPDLADLPRKAALRSYHSGHSHSLGDDEDDDDDQENSTLLPSGSYLDYSELLANITRDMKSD